jgi:hypothetical protein
MTSKQMQAAVKKILHGCQWELRQFGMRELTRRGLRIRLIIVAHNFDEGGSHISGTMRIGQTSDSRVMASGALSNRTLGGALAYGIVGGGQMANSTMVHGGLANQLWSALFYVNI